MIKYYKELEKPCDYEIKLYEYMRDPILEIKDCDEATKENLFKIIAKLEELDPIYNRRFGQIESDSFIVDNQHEEMDWDDDPFITLAIEFASSIKELKYSIANYSYTKKNMNTNDEKYQRLYYLFIKFYEANPDYDYDSEGYDLMAGEEARVYDYISSCFSLMTRIKKFNNIASVKRYVSDLLTVLYGQKKIDEEEYKDICTFLKSIATSSRIDLSDHRKEIAFKEPDAWYITPYGYLYNSGGPRGHMGRSPYKSLWNGYSTQIRAYIKKNKVLTEEEKLEEAIKELESPFGGMPKNFYFNPEDNFNYQFDIDSDENNDEAYDTISIETDGPLTPDDWDRIDDIVYEKHKNDLKSDFKLFDNDATRILERSKDKSNRGLYHVVAEAYKKKYEEQEKHDAVITAKILNDEETVGYYNAKDILEHGFVTESQFVSYLNYVGFSSIDYIGDKKNNGFISRRSYDRNIVNLIAGVASAEESAYLKFMCKLKRESNDLDRDLKKAFYDLSEEEFLVRCCGFYKVLSHFAGKKERTIVTSNPNYEKDLALYIANGWKIHYVIPFVFVDGVLQESPDEHEKLLEFHLEKF